MHVVPRNRSWSFHVAVLLLLLLPASLAHAVVRSCNPADPVGNTANVLCAAPSGPCTGALVTVSANIEVPDGVGCDFDLGGRDLVFNQTFEMTGLGLFFNGYIKVTNADDITIGSTGKLKARGDWMTPLNILIGGGLISLDADGTITMNGLIDVVGDSAGTVNLNAAGNVVLNSGSEIMGNGDSILEEGMRFADGATVDITSETGSITIGGDLKLRGQNQGSGGIADLTAERDVTIDKPIDAVGGGGDGGEVILEAGDSIVVNKNIDVTSELGGGSGGDIIIDAGTLLGGVVAGGTVTVNSSVLKAQGSSGDEGFAGDGGSVEVIATGHIRFLGGTSAIRLDAATAFDAAGGALLVDSDDGNPTTLSALDGDIEIAGTITGSSGNDAGDGASLLLNAGRDLTLSATMALNGRSGGGDVSGTAGRHVTVSGAITARGTGSLASGGDVDFTAGEADDGNLNLTASIDADGGPQSSGAGVILLAGCTMTVAAGVQVDGRGGSPSGAPGGADVDLVSLTSMSLGNNSQYLATPGGSITIHHPVGAAPVIGAGVTLSPAPSFVVGPTTTYLNCPGCGNGILEVGEVCDDGNLVNGDCCSASCTIEPAGTVCRPAACVFDTAETCTGSSPVCPADTNEATDAVVMYKAKASPRLDLPNSNKFPNNDYNLKLNDIVLPDTEPDDPENFEVAKEKSLVLPAALNAATAPANPELHYIRYQIKEAGEGSGPFNPTLNRYPSAVKHLKGRLWMLENQFGTINVTTKKTEAMLVPAAKSLTSPPAAPGDATHYICYQAKVTADVTDQTPDAGGGAGKFRKDLEGFFGDQFEDCEFDRGGDPAFPGTPVAGKCLFNLKKVKALCNPIAKADVGGTPPRETIAPPGSVSTPNSCPSLLCYQAKLSSKVLSQSAAQLSELFVDASLSQNGHEKRSLAAGNAPHTTPGNNFPAPLQMDTKKTEFVCIPTSVDSFVDP